MTASEDNTVRIGRTIGAPRDRVYAALTTSHIGQQWWVGPPWEFTTLTLDATPGGKFEYAIRNTVDGTTYATHGEYREAVPNERVVWTNAEGGGTLVTVELRDVDGGTELSVVQGAFPDAKTRDGHQAGWNACLDNLDRLLQE